jgi:hypothetical protein
MVGEALAPLGLSVSSASAAHGLRHVITKDITEHCYCLFLENYRLQCVHYIYDRINVKAKAANK